MYSFYLIFHPVGCLFAASLCLSFFRASVWNTMAFSTCMYRIYVLIPGSIAAIWFPGNARHSAIAMENPVPCRMVAIFDYDPRESSPNADIEVTWRHTPHTHFAFTHTGLYLFVRYVLLFWFSSYAHVHYSWSENYLKNNAYKKPKAQT